ncbi:hypothetical protein CCHL11_06233 [Colletotrichum chlorophyti]|uniref:Uncharacterized protein n=1 Tax=Colletotrichum chlorophyti TaxID=708187 RepID=A0A1Q8RLU6_9PEZI|nr:hypothetical protein CCHL11_06233 [Colletotrichum chlorophyti]
MDSHAPSVSWYDTMMTYSLLSSDYPSIIRYISGAFIALGFIFVGPIILLIGVDLVIWVYRVCWSRRPWNQNQNQDQNLNRNQPTHQKHKLLPEDADGNPTTVTSTVAAAARKRLQRLSESAEANNTLSG